MNEIQTSKHKSQDEAPNTGQNRKYDLKDRLFRFAKEVLHVCYSMPRTIENDVIRKQLVRAGTAVGANYAEADGAVTKKDFVNKIAIARKEAKETFYWLQLIASANNKQSQFSELIREADEIIRILSAILIKLGHKFRV
jgi:four helix bundle protein